MSLDLSKHMLCKIQCHNHLGKWKKSIRPWTCQKYSEVSIKRPVLLNDLFEFFQRDSIKRPGPSQFYVELQKNVLFLLNVLVCIF